MAFTLNPFSGNFDVVRSAKVIFDSVATFADLPTAADRTGETLIVENSTGLWPYLGPLGAEQGFYKSDGTNWIRIELTAEEIQAQIDAHATRTDNPHTVTADQVGLGNVDNTSDLDKPVSTDTQAALDAKISLFDQTPIFTADWDAASTPGVYYKNGSPTNEPPGFNNFSRGFVFEAFPATGGNQALIIQHVYNGSTGEMASRRRHPTAGWSDWAVYITNADIQASLANKADVNHTHILADIDDYDASIFATAAQGALADTALQSETTTTLAIVGTDLVYTDETGTSFQIPLSTFGEDDTNLARVTSARFGDFFTLELVRDDNTVAASIDMSPFALNTRNSALDLDATSTLTITDTDNNTVQVDLSSLDNSADITALAMGAVAANTAKVGVSGNEILEGDARLTDARAPLTHTHVEEDITDLDKYTQEEVDDLIEDRVTALPGALSIFVAPDAASQQAGDIATTGGTGIRDAIREASRFMLTNPTSLITIFLRPGEYTLISPIESSHPQAKKVLRIRPVPLLNSTDFQNMHAALTGTDQVADDATLAAGYSVIINCPSFGLFFDKGTGIDGVDSILFRYTGTNTSRAAFFASQQGSITLARCAAIGFPYGVRSLEFASVGVTVGCFFVHCNLAALRAEESSVIRVTQSVNYRHYFHSKTQNVAQALTNAYIRLVGTATGITTCRADATNRAVLFADDNSTINASRLTMIGGDEGALANQGSVLSLANSTITGNTTEAMKLTNNSTGNLSNCTADAAGTDRQRTYLAEGDSRGQAVGTNTNFILDPVAGSQPDTSSIN